MGGVRLLDPLDPPMNLGVLESTRRVVERSRHVEIDREAIAALAAAATAAGPPAFPDFTPPAWDSEHHYVARDPADTAMYTLVQDTLNFCFWGTPPWEVTYRGRTFTGYYALTAALRRALEVGCPLLDATFLECLSRVDIEFILRGAGDLPLMEERLAALREVGRTLNARYGGSFAAMIGSAGGSAVRLASSLARELLSFDDRAEYAGEEVRFFKRAQLCVADLHGALGGRGLGAFGDLDHLTAFADYELPRVLREFGVLRFGASLAARVGAGDLIPSGSPEEVEIRAATVWAVELLRRALAEAGRSLRAFELDWILWNWSQERPARYPHHRTLGVYY